jgi:predicted ATPase/class 3 adenylate cyclase
MAELPTGIVTFLFTDIQGSTPLWERDPDGMREALALHNAVLADAIAAHDGHWFKTVGDAFQAAFADSAHAVHAAVAGQRGLAQAEWGRTGPLLVRMGIHTGSAIAEGTDYATTHTLNRVARIMSAAHGGQIVLSQEVLDEIAHRMPEEITLRDMDKHRMKGLTHLEHLYQVIAPDLPTEFPRLNTLDISPNNLPLQLTSFIGREKELREGLELLSTSRLVTLTGPGGCGKTRLSLEIAEREQDTHPHGVWLVELAPLADSALIPQTLATVLGLREQVGLPILAALTDFLRTRTLLLVLDNCEHLIEACARLAEELLKACPKIHILASSRETLGISGEAVYRVPSLGVPDLHQRLPLDQLLEYASVKLFVERAGTVLPGFSITDDNAPAVVQVCHRLDGIPLAIELAAARVNMLTVEQIAARLDDRFRLLTGGSRTALPRQQTLRALIDWSFSLLSEPECVLFRRLSVFAGGWTLDAAEAVCAEDYFRAGEGIETFDVLDLLSQLASKSLVMVEREQGKDARYRLLETIRQYAREKLLEAGGGEQTRDQHLFFFMALAEKAEAELSTSRSVFWTNRLRRDQDNIRAALAWSLERNVEAGLRLASAQMRYWIDSGSVQDGGDWFSQLLDQPDASISMPTRAKALNVFGVLSTYKGRNIEGMRLAEEGLSLYRQLGDRKGEAFSLYGLSVFYTFTDDLRKGRLFANESLEIYKELGDKAGIAEVLTFLGAVGSNKDYQQARCSLEEGLALYRELGAQDRIAWCLSLLGRLEMWNGDFILARKTLEEALAIQSQLEVNEISETIIDLGMLTFREGNLVQARLQLEEGLQICQESGRTDMATWAMAHLGFVALRQGDQAQAYRLFVQGQKRFAKGARKIGVAYVMEGMASLAVMQNKFDKAVRIFAWTDKTREEIDEHLQPVEQADVDRDFAVIRSHLGNAKIEIAYAAGRAMTMEQAIALAMEDDDAPQ